jgi:S-(hydroxymethyl)glutathione dehydrogenase/alcohol dehydrogenase
VVEAVGAGVEGVGPGDAVAMLWRPRCGRCQACIAGQPVLCELGRVQAATGGLPDDGTTRLRLRGREVHHLMGVSCFAERAVVSAKSVVAIPAGVPAPVAAIAGCAVITGVGAVMNVVGECAGRSLLIVGAGGVGLSAVMGAVLAGADPILVADVDAARLDRARALGATHTVHAGEEDLVAAVLAAVPDGVDWAIEAVGRAETLGQAVECLRPGGTAVAVGLAAAGATFELPINDLVQRQKRVVGSLYGSANPLLDLPRIFRLYLSGRLPIDALLGRRYPLGSVNEAYADLLEGAIGRGVILPAQ